MNTQVMNALQRGQELRLAGAAYRREIATLGSGGSLLRIADLLDSPPEPIQRMRVDRLLTAAHRIGADSARRILDELHINPLRYVGPTANESIGHRPLSEHQRRKLAEELRRRANSPRRRAA